MGKNRYALKHPQTVISHCRGIFLLSASVSAGAGSAYQRRMARCRQRRRWHVCSRSTRMPASVDVLREQSRCKGRDRGPKRKKKSGGCWSCAIRISFRRFPTATVHPRRTGPRQKKRRMELQNIWRISAVSMWCCGRKRESCGPL